MKKIEKYFHLTNTEISEVIEQVRSLGQEGKADRVLLLRGVLSLEEILLNDRDHFGEKQQVKMTIRSLPGQMKVSFELKGRRMNPLEAEENSEMGGAFENLGMTPQYSYFSGINRIELSISIALKVNMAIMAVAAVLLGIVLGLLGGVLPPGIFASLQALFSAVSSAIMGVMCMIATPVIFLCVLSGIIGSGSVSDFKQNGLKVISVYLLDTFLVLLLATVLGIPIFGLTFSKSAASEGTVQLILDCIFSMIPNNIFTPFIDGNNAQVIVLAVLIGCASLVLKGKTPLFLNFVQETKNIFQVMLGWIGNLIPLLLVVTIASGIWSGLFSVQLLKLWKLLLLYAVLIVLISSLSILRAARHTHLPFSAVLKAVAGPTVKGFLTCSSMLCYADMENGLLKQLNRNETDISYQLPFSYTFFQTLTVIDGLIALFFAAYSGITVDAAWIATYLLVCFMLTMGSPPGSGGTTAILIILMTTLGIPQDCISVACPLLMLLDYFITAFRILATMTEAANTAKENEKE